MQQTSTGLLEDREQQQAALRAQAAAIADAPRPQRRYTVAPGAQLRPSPRRRQAVPVLRRAAPKRRALLPRRVIAAAILLAQVALLALALTLPAFQVQRLSVSGERLLSSQTIIGAADVQRQSIFTVDASTIRSRILMLPWVQDATVTTGLPNIVRITVVERTPAVRVRRLGVDTFVATTGAALAATPALEQLWSGVPALLDGRTGSAQPLDPRLLSMIPPLAQHFGAVYGVKIAGFVIGADNVFSIWTTAGWRAVLGHLDTDDAFAAVPAQLSSLAALKTHVSFTQPDFGYVDLENPETPAVGGSPGLPSEVQSIDAPPVPVVPSDTQGGLTTPHAL